MGIRERIKEAMAAAGDMSPRALSLKAGLSDSMMHKFLSGFSQSMSIENLERVAKALEVNPRWLIWGDAPVQVDPKIAYIWDHIPARNREQALRVLETFTEAEKAEPGNNM